MTSSAPVECDSAGSSYNSVTSAPVLMEATTANGDDVGCLSPKHVVHLVPTIPAEVGAMKSPSLHHDHSPLEDRMNGGPSSGSPLYHPGPMPVKSTLPLSAPAQGAATRVGGEDDPDWPGFVQLLGSISKGSLNSREDRAVASTQRSRSISFGQHMSSLEPLGRNHRRASAASSLGAASLTQLESKPSSAFSETLRTNLRDNYSNSEAEKGLQWRQRMGKLSSNSHHLTKTNSSDNLG